MELRTGMKVRYRKGGYYELTEQIGEGIFRAQGLPDHELCTCIGVSSIEEGYFTVVDEEDWESKSKGRSKAKTVDNVRSLEVKGSKKSVSKTKKILGNPNTCNTDLSGEDLYNEKVYDIL